MASDLKLPEDMREDLHEDLTNLYLRYLNRYAEREDNEGLRIGTVICTMMEVVSQIENDLFVKTVGDAIRDILRDEENG